MRVQSCAREVLKEAQLSHYGGAFKHILYALGGDDYYHIMRGRVKAFPDCSPELFASLLLMNYVYCNYSEGHPLRNLPPDQQAKKALQLFAAFVRKRYAPKKVSCVGFGFLKDL
jgi:hypothetical protein